jgi:cytochrome c oxidase subunit 2
MKPGRLALILITMLLLAGCDGMQSALDAKGAGAIEIKQLIVGIVAVCTVIWLLVIVVLARALMRPQGAAGGSNPQTQRRMTVVILGAVAATVIIIAGLTIASFYTTRSISVAADGDLTVKIRGHQWWWRVQYVDADPAKSFETANEIHIPVGTNVRLQLESADVIHSFLVPSLAGKQDLIPGRLNELTIRAERPGIYRGQCAEFCGIQHSHMAMLVIAEDNVDYEKWMAGQRSDATPSSDQEASAGKAVFLSKPCAACHAIRGANNSSAGTGPDLTHVGGRKTIAAGVVDNTRGSLAAWIADPQTMKPGSNMPIVPLSSEELRQISAYMASLK